MNKTVSILFLISTINFSLFAQRKKNWAYRDLSHLKFLTISIESKGKSLSKELANDNAGDSIKIVSAEKVFEKVFKDLKYPKTWLVNFNYQKSVKPIKTDGKTVVDKWGSSYNTWGMSKEKWESIDGFEWISMNFPILWTKKPEIYNGNVSFLTKEGNVKVLPKKEFKIYLKAAREWLEPDKIQFSSLLKIIEVGSTAERNFAIRLLGKKKDYKAIPIIEKNLLKQNSDVQNSCYWALTEIGNNKAFPILIKSFYNPGSSTSSIAATMCKLDPKRALVELSSFLEDKEVSKERKRGIVNGIFQVKLPSLCNLYNGKLKSQKTQRIAINLLKGKKQEIIKDIVPLLNENEKRTRNAAMDALVKLGWKPGN